MKKRRKLKKWVIPVFVILILLIPTVYAFYFSKYESSIISKFIFNNDLTDSYIRATVVTYWIDTNECLDNNDLTTCNISGKASWNLKDEAINYNWILLDDGYYYYKTSINSRDITKDNIKTSEDAYKDKVPDAHEIKTMQAKEPTCTESGLTEGKYCELCRSVFVSQQTVDALGHIEIVDKGYAATCTEDGLTEGKHCDREGCKKVLVAQEVIKSQGHNIIFEKGYEATCTQKGKTDNKYCDVCNEVFEKAVYIPAKGHNIVVLEAVAPTCATVGKTEGLGCKNCDYRVIPQADIEKLPHKTITVGKKASTYTSKGYTGDKVCSVCKEVIKKGKSTALKKLKAPKISLLAKSGKLTVKYKKISIKINGKWKKFTTKKLKFSKKLTKGKTYQVKVRAFVTKNNKKYYGRYSNVKKITVK